MFIGWEVGIQNIGWDGTLSTIFDPLKTRENNFLLGEDLHMMLQELEWWVNNHIVCL